MFDRQELATLVQTIQIQSPRERKSQDFALAILFAGQVIVCAVLLHSGYYLFRAQGVYWAIISAILVLQPGFAQSVNASVTRIAANLIGALIGLVIGYSLGTGSWQVVSAMVIVIFICEPLRLDFGLRTACVSAIIVMTAHGSESVLTNSIERFLAVVVGCGLALVVQLLADRIREKLGWQKMLAPPPSAGAPTLIGTPPPAAVMPTRSGPRAEE